MNRKLKRKKTHVLNDELSFNYRYFGLPWPFHYLILTV